ncbi:hypothetical protein [Allgaiera indica]|uniref:hypothetical protein n=1 Tax=Allgaiera indica TaxID=765699 RepID=UPI001362CF2D|nr:hypothetical protein [Allgaiera indica]
MIVARLQHVEGKAGDQGAVVALIGPDPSDHQVRVLLARRASGRDADPDRGAKARSPVSDILAEVSCATGISVTFSPWIGGQITPPSPDARQQ